MARIKLLCLANAWRRRLPSIETCRPMTAAVDAPAAAKPASLPSVRLADYSNRIHKRLSITNGAKEPLKKAMTPASGTASIAAPAVAVRASLNDANSEFNMTIRSSTLCSSSVRVPLLSLAHVPNSPASLMRSSITLSNAFIHSRLLASNLSTSCGKS